MRVIKLERKADMKILQLAFIIFISGLIGYSTNVLAIRALFRPYEPKKIGPFIIQGLIPKRRGDLAKTVGEVVANDLINHEDFLDQFISPEDEQKIIYYLTDRIQQEVTEKTWALPKIIQDKINRSIAEKLQREGPEIFMEIKSVAENQLMEKVDIGAMIEGEINKMDVAELEAMTIHVANKELRSIEWLGLIMGLAIGLIQGFITIYLLK